MHAESSFLTSFYRLISPQDETPTWEDHPEISVDEETITAKWSGKKGQVSSASDPPQVHSKVYSLVSDHINRTGEPRSDVSSAGSGNVMPGINQHQRQGRTPIPFDLMAMHSA